MTSSTETGGHSHYWPTRNSLCACGAPYATSNANYVRCFWRVGGQVGRTIYAQGPGDEKGVLIGVMDTRELAIDACTHHNNFLYSHGTVTGRVLSNDP